MKGFMLDESGDVVIKNNQIQIVENEELLRQTVKTLLGTNQGEWNFNSDEGIDFRKILIKNPDYDVIKNEIYKGLLQIDSTFILNEFNCSLNKHRKLNINFMASNSSGNIVKGGGIY